MCFQLPCDVFNSDNNFVAARAFAGNITYVHGSSVPREAEVFLLVSRLPTSHCTHLPDEYVIPGKGSAGLHMCFVMPACGGVVSALVELRSAAFQMAINLLCGIPHTHEG